MYSARQVRQTWSSFHGREGPTPDINSATMQSLCAARVSVCGARETDNVCTSDCATPDLPAASALQTTFYSAEHSPAPSDQVAKQNLHLDGCSMIFIHAARLHRRIANASFAEPLRRARATMCAVQAAAALMMYSCLLSIHTQWGSNHHSSATAPRRLNLRQVVNTFFYPRTCYIYSHPQ